jgi:hypothetical protein
MELENEQPLHVRLQGTQRASRITGILFVITALVSFVLGCFFIITSSDVRFLSEFYIVMGVLLFLLTAILIVPGLQFLKFSEHKMTTNEGSLINYRFKTFRNTLIYLCVIFGIAAVISFIGGSAIFLEEVTRNFRQY